MPYMYVHTNPLESEMRKLLSFLAYLSQDAIDEIFYAYSVAKIAEMVGCSEDDVRAYLEA